MTFNADSRPAVYNERSTGTSSSDFGQLSNINKILESRNSWDQQLTGGQASDSNLNASTQTYSLPQDSPLRVGKVLLAFPYIHCYKIQLSGRQGTVVATALSRGSSNPLGVRVSDVIPPNSNVLIWYPNASTMAYILAVLPAPTLSDSFNPSEMLQQGGNSGVKKVEAYRNIPKVASVAHNWVPQSCGRPMDGTIGEYVRMSETGIGLLIDSFQAYLRVNESCGLWLNYFDSYAKLSALSMQIQSYCEHVFQQYDEGELFSMRGYATYPWEAAGTYAPGETISKNNNVEAVQMDRDFPFAIEDLEDFSTVPVYRMTDYTGYLGQGFNRTLVRPAKTSGVRKMTDAEADKDIGLFQELLALDGGYSVRSAKQILFAKYPLIPNPRRKRQVEDAQGDDLKEDNNYRFSGLYGNGEEHKVREWQDSGITDIPNMLRAAGVMDMLVRHFNWKSTHPFYYHQKDYTYPDEGSNDSQLTDVKFYRGNMNSSYVEIAPKSLTIDNRYQNVNYYNTASFITLAEDGSVVIADGYGSQITMGGGQIRLEAGGDVMLMSGARVVTLANEAIIRAKGSIDLSSSEKDVRLKAENNMQLLAGNSGEGGMLLESKGEGSAQVYKQMIGEEVNAAGITLLSRGGSINTIAKTTYMRTGVDAGNPESSGEFIIDCANGRSSMVSYAASHVFFNSQGLGIYHSPVGQDDVSIDESHYFGPNFSKIHGPTVMDKDVCIVKEGNLGVDKSIYTKGNVIALKQMACLKGIQGIGDSSKNNIPDDVNKFIEEYQQASDQVNEQGTPQFEAYFTNNVWQEDQPGNSSLLGNDIGFSYRDDSDQGGEVYSYQADKFFLLEPRWQQLERMGFVQGSGETWTENPVQYQGKELYPWPGKANWVEGETLLGYSDSNTFLLFGSDGKAKGREANQSDYEQPQFKSWKKQVCDGNYKL